MNTSPFAVCTVRVQRFDIPLVQPIHMSFGRVDRQNVVLVSVCDADGRSGYGEAVALGGPYWGAESAEAIFTTLVKYIAPPLLERSIHGAEDIARFLRLLIRGNSAAKSAMEMAVLDLIARRSEMSVAGLLGGYCRTVIPVAWTLSTGSVDGDIAEGEHALESRGHSRFKVKLAKKQVATDVQRVVQIIDAFHGRASVIADVNQGWDEITARKYLPALQEAGLEAIEQPLPLSASSASARIASTLKMELIADEALTDATAALSIAARGGASAFALKPNRDGGLIASRQLASIANAARLKVYGGTALETSLGTAASAHLYSALPELELGSELFGPLRLKYDITDTRISVTDGHLRLPEGPGFGVVPDQTLIRELLIEQATV